MIYENSTQSKKAFTKNVFAKFTDACGGDEYEFANKLYAKYVVEDFAYHDDCVYWNVLGYFENVVVPHKIEVYKAGKDLLTTDWVKQLNIDQEQFAHNLWVHDMSKFCADEAFGYASYNRKTGYGKEGFERAWHHHKMHNPHHPEYWLNPNRAGELEVLPMEKIYVLEMLADWIGAGKTYGSSLEEWAPVNVSKFKFHPETQQLVRYCLQKMGIEAYENTKV